jgi:hypothetical protein
MSFEVINTLATCGTFLVIAATAIAAIIQLRHLRCSNQIAALNEVCEPILSTDFLATWVVGKTLALKLRDPAFRYELAWRSARTDENRPLIGKIYLLGNTYENMGILVSAGLVDRELVLKMWASSVVSDWETIAPATVILRRLGGADLWENFEYLTVLSQDWLANHPKGSYPPDMRRIELKDEWLEADQQYAALETP